MADVGSVGFYFRFQHVHLSISTSKYSELLVGGNAWAYSTRVQPSNYCTLVLTNPADIFSNWIICTARANDVQLLMLFWLLSNVPVEITFHQ